MRKTWTLLALMALIVPLLFLGCGDDGATGPAGPPGPPSEVEGPPGPVTNVEEACMICHTTGRIADISDVDTEVITHYRAGLHNPLLVVDNIAVTNVGGVASVSFRVRANSTVITALDNGSVRFMLADLVPAGTATSFGTWNTAQFDRYAYDRTGTGNLFGTFDNTTGAATGNYTYTFARAFGLPSPADNVVPVAFDNAHVQRLYIRVSKTGYTNGAGFLDFIIPNPGATTTGIGYFERQFTTVEACMKCHGPLLANTAHGGGYRDVKTCVLCHSPIVSALEHEGPPPVSVGELMTLDNTTAWLAALVHKIHAAIPIPAFASRISGQGYGGVGYPQDVRNCTTCHTDSGLALGAGDQIDNWKTHPTANACKTCHAGFDSVPAHQGGSLPDSTCTTCHSAEGTSLGGSVANVHDTVLNRPSSNIPEFDVTLNLTPPANGTHYVAGNVVLATVTLRNHADNTAVDNAVYTAPRDAAAGSAGGGLRVANIAFYGPRAFPKPIFDVDPATGLQFQNKNLFVSTTDNNVKTDATGFKYQVVIPSGLTSGTYMVRVRIGDYSRVSDNNFVVESIAFRTVQIGSATATEKVSGNACVDCHGNGSAPFHDARHISVWDTDECNACHDYSGNHAATLSNRVHAVHAGNSYGDMTNPLGFDNTTQERDWSDVRWPGDRITIGAAMRPTRCTHCHTNGGTLGDTSTGSSYRRTIHEVACLGCHGDPVTGGTTTPGPAINHMFLNGGDYPMPAAP